MKNSYFIVIIILNLSITTLSRIVDNEVDKYVNENGNCILSEKLQQEIKSYQPIVNRIINEIVNGQFAGETWTSLGEFVDKFGPRMSGSQSLEDSIDYALRKMQEAGLNAYTENATVPNWKRGFESASLISPRTANLPLLGLGSTIGTPRGGIVADVIAVESFTEFDELDENEVRGKIVVFAPKWESYGKTVQYRSRGAAVAAKKGAVATLIRSVTPFSLGTPHTGHQNYQDGVKKIPTACITVEDAEMILRMYRRKENIRIRLEMNDQDLGLAQSRNVIGELQGTQANSSVVIVSGHIDSWDVGVGAMDDGGGAFISWHAAKYLFQMGLRARRTIRAILWTGEEQGYWGARSYQKNHSANEKEEFNFFIESDIGTFTPRGLDFSGNKDAECILREIVNLMTLLNATDFETPTDGGPDISVWTDRGFPGASLLNKNENYFWFHHSAGDSMLVEDPKALDKCTALFAAAAYVIADLSVEIPKSVS